MSTTETAAFAWADTGTVPFGIRPGAVPIKWWANPIDPRTFEQARNLSNQTVATQKTVVAVLYRLDRGALATARHKP